MSPETTIQTEKKTGRAYVVVIGLALMMIGTMGTSSSSMGIFTAPISEYWGVPTTAIALYFTLRNVMMFVAQPLCGRLFAKFSPRVLAIIGAALSGLSFAGMSIYPALFFWYIAAFLDGFGLAVICYMLSPTILRNWFKVNFGTMLGIVTAFTGVGGMIFQTMSGACIASMGVRPAYAAVGFTGMIVSLIGAVVLLKDAPDPAKGEAPVGWNMTAEEIAKSGSGKKAKASPMDTIGFKQSEAMKNPIFWLVGIGSCCLFLIATFMSSITTFAVSLGFDIANAALVSTTMTAGIIVGKLVVGKLGDSNHMVAAAASLILTVVSLVLLLMSGNGAIFTFVGAFLFGAVVATMSICPPLSVKGTMGNVDYTGIFGAVMAICQVGSMSAHLIYNGLYDATGTYYGGLAAAIVLGVIHFVLIMVATKMANKKWAPIIAAQNK